MSLLISGVAAAAEAQMVAPTWVFPLIAGTVFITLGAVTWSFRDVANRHSHKVNDGASHH